MRVYPINPRNWEFWTLSRHFHAQFVAVFWVRPVPLLSYYRTLEPKWPSWEFLSSKFSDRKGVLYICCHNTSQGHPDLTTNSRKIVIHSQVYKILYEIVLFSSGFLKSACYLRNESQYYFHYSIFTILPQRFVQKYSEQC